MLRILFLAAILCAAGWTSVASAQIPTDPADNLRKQAADGEESRLRRDTLEAERARLAAELKETQELYRAARAERDARKKSPKPPATEEDDRLNREEELLLSKLEEGRAKLGEKLKEIESQLRAIPAATANLPRRFAADERFRQRLSEYQKMIAKLRADGNEAAAQRLEAEANDFAQQNGERTRVELEVMRNQVDQLRSSGRAAEAAQLEKAIAARTDAVAAADRAIAEFRAAPGDNPVRARPMSNLDQMSRDAIVRRIDHFRRAQQHLQEVGRGEIVEQLQREIDRLENRLAALEAPQPAAPELSRLQAENDQLRRDVAALKQAVDRLTEALKEKLPPREPMPTPVPRVP